MCRNLLRTETENIIPMRAYFILASSRGQLKGGYYHFGTSERFIILVSHVYWFIGFLIMDIELWE